MPRANHQTTFGRRKDSPPGIGDDEPMAHGRHYANNTTLSEVPHHGASKLDDSKVLAESKVLSFLKAENLEEHPTIVNSNPRN